MKIAPYLNFSGKCEEAFRTYERVLGGKIVGMFNFGDSPMAANIRTGKEGDACCARGRGSDHSWLRCAAGVFSEGAGMAVCLDLPDAETAERVYAGLSEGGDVKMPLQETFWAKRYAHFIDRFGTPWMINVTKPM